MIIRENSESFNDIIPGRLNRNEAVSIVIQPFSILLFFFLWTLIDLKLYNKHFCKTDKTVEFRMCQKIVVLLHVVINNVNSYSALIISHGQK